MKHIIAFCLCVLLTVGAALLPWSGTPDIQGTATASYTEIKSPEEWNAVITDLIKLTELSEDTASTYRSATVEIFAEKYLTDSSTNVSKTEEYTPTFIQKKARYRITCYLNEDAIYCVLDIAGYDETEMSRRPYAALETYRDTEDLSVYAEYYLTKEQKWVRLHTLDWNDGGTFQNRLDDLLNQWIDLNELETIVKKIKAVKLLQQVYDCTQKINGIEDADSFYAAVSDETRTNQLNALFEALRDLASNEYFSPYYDQITSAENAEDLAEFYDALRQANSMKPLAKLFDAIIETQEAIASLYLNPLLSLVEMESLLSLQTEFDWEAEKNTYTLSQQNLNDWLKKTYKVYSLSSNPANCLLDFSDPTCPMLRFHARFLASEKSNVSYTINSIQISNINSTEIIVQDTVQTIDFYDYLNERGCYLERDGN